MDIGENDMKKQKLAVVWLLSFVLWTVLVRCVDVQPIGPEESSVGFATINGLFHQMTGVHLALYTITDWLSMVPLGIAAGFGLLGLYQWIVRKGIRKVDRSILILGYFYGAVMAVFALFEVLVINYRPILIEGVLEPSYPSSTTMLMLCILPAAAMRCRRKWLATVLWLFAICMVIARLLSGVHWLTDIIGGVLLSAGLVTLYDSLTTT